MEYIDAWVEQHVSGETPVMLLLYVVIVLLAVVIFNFILRRFLARMEKMALQTQTSWDDALVSAARRPASWLAWVVGLSFAADIVKAETNFALLKAVPVIRTVGVIVCFAWFLTYLIRNMQQAFLRQQVARGETPDRTTIDAVGQILRIVVIVIAFLVGLQSLGFSISGVLAFGGIGGIAIGFAAKDLLANFFGGLMIHMDRPFAIGDWIRSSEKQIEGTVEEIGWKITRIRTFDKRPLYIPNSIFTSITVENASRMTHRRINETIGVRYDDINEIAGIVGDIRAMLLDHPEIDQKQPVNVNFVQFNEFSLDIMVEAFTRTIAKARFLEAKQDALLKIAGIIAKHGSEIAYPTRVNYNARVLSAQTVDEPDGSSPEIYPRTK